MGLTVATRPSHSRHDHQAASSLANVGVVVVAFAAVFFSLLLLLLFSEQQ